MGPNLNYSKFLKGLQYYTNSKTCAILLCLFIKRKVAKAGRKIKRKGAKAQIKIQKESCVFFASWHLCADAEACASAKASATRG
jgi:hypothetical protein